MGGTFLGKMDFEGTLSPELAAPTVVDSNEGIADPLPAVEVTEGVSLYVFSP